MPKKYFPKEEPIIKGRQTNIIWSSYQKEIFKEIAKGKGNLIVEARAGSAKTSSMVESFRYIPKGKKTIALAFNKIIQEELKSRSPSYVECLTFHSLGLRAIKQKFGNIELDDSKVFDIVANQVGKNYELTTNICDTVAYCKYGLLDTPTQIEWVINQFNVDLCDLELKEFIKIVVKTLALDKANTKKIDFNDMCWFPFVHNLSLGKYDYIYADECQDLNKSQLIMAKKLSHADSRIIMIGDPLQQLYKWRMSDDTVLQEMRDNPSTKILKLPICYRCPKKVIELAKYWAEDIECPENTPEGNVEEIALNELYDKAKPGCFILSRTNAPLIKICMKFIKLGIKANIRGRDIGGQLSYLIKKSKKKNIPSFLKYIEKWKDDEVEKLKSKGFNPENILDKYECLVNLCEEFSTLEDVVKKINEMFNDVDDNNIIWLSSIHRAKGLEKENVFILKWTLRVHLTPSAEFLEKPNEEGNISYVASTRAKKNLYFVNKVAQSSINSV